MSLPSLSIKNPVFAWMLMAGMMLFGLISFRGMGIGQMPDIDFPVLSISLDWEGTSPEVMETDVVDIVEDAVIGIQGLKDVSSSVRQGSAQVTLEFELERDIDVALQEVQSKLSEAQRRLPTDMDPPVIGKNNPEDQPIMWLAVSSDRPVRDIIDVVDRQIKDRFKSVRGVGEVILGGFVEPNLRVWLDSKKLLDLQLTVEDVIDAIQGEHVESPAGRLETAEREANVRAMGEAASVEEFNKITITRRNGQPIYKPILLSEVARVEEGLADIRRISRVMGKPAIGLGIRKQRGMNTVEVAHRVKERMKEVAKELPEGFNIGVNFDSTQFIEHAVDELVFTLFLSAILTSLVCWMFLGSWSSTLNIILAIPTSLLGTFVILKFAGFTLNTFTLLGLSLAIGIVVDDAIMVLENIVRHREKGQGQTEAALKGTEEIQFAALAATTAIVAIFLPVFYMAGIIGKFFFQFGVTMSVAVILSLIEALTLTPMRCSQFLEIGERKSRFGKAFERGMESMKRKYARALEYVVFHKAKALLILLGVFILSLAVMPLVRKELVPAQEQSMFLVRLQTPIGSSLEYTSEQFKKAEKLMMDHGSVRRYYAAVGGFGGGEVNSGMLFVSLKSPGERPVDRKLKRKPTQADMMDFVRKEFNAIPGLKAFVQDLSMRGFAARRGFPIELSVRGPDWDKLVDYSHQIMEKMKQSKLFQDVDTDYLSGMPELRIYPDREKAFGHGVSIGTIAGTINAMIGGERIAKYTQGGRRYDVRVQVESSQRTRKEDIQDLMLWNNRGEMVRLGDVVTMKEQDSLMAITRRNRERAIEIFANLGKKVSQQDAIVEAEKIAGEILPEGYRAVLGGSSETFKESFSSFTFALWLGIAIAYMVLASQFNSFVHPWTVLLALPFSVSGAFIALFLTGHSLNMFSFIGLLLLLGIVKKNSILLVEFANQLREQGMDAVTAIKTAGPVRLRPIIMTTVATVAAAVPPALAIGPGAETRVPMAIVVIGGVLVSTLLTLFAVPAAYIVLSRFERKKKKGMAETTGSRVK